ncbi:MAG: type II toxin-antitoxin system prevent-host-death family antitoxin [Planctomycetes bacterium]|nr:type II toxin-antitoxin system prevent-host-death family antitoxin [Planctomycetota bacterium]
MTMLRSRWNLAAAKAGMSRLIRRSRRSPQIVQRRGRPVAVVLGIEDYRRVAEREESARRWRAVLAASADVRAGGRIRLRLPRRVRRRSPLGA